MKKSVFLRFCVTIMLLAGLLLEVMVVSVPAQSGRKRQVNPPPSSQSDTQDQQSNKQQDDRRGSDKPLADNTPVTVGEDGTIKLDTSLVSIPVTVSDRNGKFAPFLKKQDFRLYEDGIEQEIESFEPVEVPFNVVLVLDTSNSTRFKFEDIQDAALAFIDQLRQDDRVMVVSFDDRVRFLSDFTNDRQHLRRAVYEARIGGSTKLYDAVDQVVQRLDQIDGRKAIVIFTDGVDTSSRRATAQSTIEQVEESGALVYPISYDTEDFTQGGGVILGNPRGMPPIFNPWPIPRRPGTRVPRWPFNNFINFQFPGQWPQGGRNRGGNGEYIRGGRYLQELADRSGGRLYPAENLGNVSRAFSQIAEELRHQYALSYYPTNSAKDGTYRQVKVRVNQTGLVVRARNGYRAVLDSQAKADNGNDEYKRPELKRKQLADIK